MKIHFPGTLFISLFPFSIARRREFGTPLPTSYGQMREPRLLSVGARVSQSTRRESRELFPFRKVRNGPGIVSLKNPLERIKGFEWTSPEVREKRTGRLSKS